MITKRIFWALTMLGMIVISTAAQEANRGRGLDPLARQKTMTLDVACGCRTFSFNRGVALDQAMRGDGFIVNGKIFPAGTLPAGPASNDPNDPGSVGKWACRGTQAVSFADIIAGAPQPHAFITQYHLSDDGRGLVSEGPTGEPIGVATAGGGLGAFSGTSGDLSAAIIGVNNTGCPNIRFTINLNKK